VNKKLKYVRSVIKGVEDQLKRLTPGNFSHTIGNQIQVLYCLRLDLQKLEEKINK
jgi:hypothetical protein